MPGLLRIGSPRRSVIGSFSESSSKPELTSYFDRLYKLIPGEIVGLYLVGAGLIPKEHAPVLVSWCVFCLVALIALRIKLTKDEERGLGPQWAAIAISAISFVIWIYSIGGPFAAYPNYNLYIPYVGSLLVLAWTFIVPLLYSPAPTDS